MLHKSRATQRGLTIFGEYKEVIIILRMCSWCFNFRQSKYSVPLRVNKIHSRKMNVCGNLFSVKHWFFRDTHTHHNAQLGDNLSRRCIFFLLWNSYKHKTWKSITKGKSTNQDTYNVSYVSYVINHRTRNRTRPPGIIAHHYKYLQATGEWNRVKTTGTGEEWQLSTLKPYFTKGLIITRLT